ncbi:MAG: hypothetical protein QM765_07850 [Myxococcales bacterium]
MGPEIHQESRAVGALLRDLFDHAPSDRDSLEAWTDKAIRLSEQWSPAICDHIPHAVWHWISDADIRLKDAEYARAQNEWMKQVIAWLESGAETPWVDKETLKTIPLSPLALFGVLVLAAGLATLAATSLCR